MYEAEDPKTTFSTSEECGLSTAQLRVVRDGKVNIEILYWFIYFTLKASQAFKKYIAVLDS